MHKGSMQRAACLQHGARGGCSYKIEDAPRIGVLKEGELFLYSGPDSDSNVDANALPPPLTHGLAHTHPSAPLTVAQKCAGIQCTAARTAAPTLLDNLLPGALTQLSATALAPSPPEGLGAHRCIGGEG